MRRQRLPVVGSNEVADSVRHGSADHKAAAETGTMWRRTALHIAGGVLCMATLGMAAAAPQPAGPPLPPRAHGFMLYLSQPIGGGAAVGGPRFGFRIEQVRFTGNTGAPDAGNPMQHRTLVGWQFGGSKVSEMRLELGGRVTYDLRHGGFALQSASRFPQRASSRSGGAFDFAPRAPDLHVPQEQDAHARAARLAGPELDRTAPDGGISDFASRSAAAANGPVHLACCIARFVGGEEHINGRELHRLPRAPHGSIRAELR